MKRSGLINHSNTLPKYLLCSFIVTLVVYSVSQHISATLTFCNMHQRTADREEIDPSLMGPRASPIASVSLGSERLFAFMLNQDLQLPTPRSSSEDDVVAQCRLKHGSLCIMENVCQFLYKHSLLPEPAVRGVRINLTFRCKAGVAPATDPEPRPLPQHPEVVQPTVAQLQSTLELLKDDKTLTKAQRYRRRRTLKKQIEKQRSAVLAPQAPRVFVGRTRRVQHKPDGWKNQVFIA